MILTRRFALAAPLLSSVPAFAQDAGSADPVRRLYATYGIGSNESMGFRDKEAVVLFSRSLYGLYRRAGKAGLDYDFFVQGQDYSLAKPIEIVRTDVTGDRASIAAVLTQSFDDGKGKKTLRKDRFTFKTVREGGVWRIDDAAHGRRTARQEWQETIKAGR